MKQHIVTGAVAVAKTESGSERYLYRGAIIGKGFTEESVKHLLSVGLIEERAEVEPAPATDPNAEFDAAVRAEVERVIETDFKPDYDRRVQEAAEKLLAGSGDRGTSGAPGRPPAAPKNPAK